MEEIPDDLREQYDKACRILAICEARSGSPQEGSLGEAIAAAVYGVKLIIERVARLTAESRDLRASYEAMRLAEKFVEEELEVRKTSFLPEGSAYIDEAEHVLTTWYLRRHF